jgi:hypothetical protein
MRAWLLVLLLLPATPAAATHYRGVTLAPDQSALVLRTDHGDVRAPRTEPDQQGFDDPQLSPDGTMAGWLVLEASCCASYPLPTMLVLYRDGHVVQRLAGDMVIWAWAFSADDGRAVAFRERTPHGISTISYSLRNVADGRLLAKFACYPARDTPAGLPPAYVPDGKVPAWVLPVAEECPSRATPATPDSTAATSR